MKLSTFIIIMACSPLLGCAAQETFPPNSPLSWLRNRVFGSRVAEDRFVSRVAVAMQSLVNVVNDPIVVRELRKYYASLLRSPEVAKLVESVRPPNRPSRRRGGVAKTSRTTTTTTTTTPVLSTPTTTTPVPLTILTTVGPNAAPTTPSSTSHNVSSKPLGDVVSVSRPPIVRTSNKYRFYFDPALVVQYPNSSSFRSRVRRHLNLVRLNDVENCVSFLICEMSRYPLRFGPLGVKVDRFFRYPMWDTGSSAAHYAALARNGRRYGCRGRITSCRHPIGPLYRQHYRFQYGNV
ncbi:uncharacterized protein LOC144135232 [Amblyomma americanum]